MDGSDKENQEDQVTGNIIQELHIKGHPYDPEQDQYGKTKESRQSNVNNVSHVENWKPEQLADETISGKQVHANLGVGIVPKRKVA